MQRSPRIGIVADDLTSATGGASPFVSRGHRPAILRSLDRPSDVLAVDTGSRAAADGARAAASTTAAVEALRDGRLLFEAVDATLRGWVREDTRAGFEASARATGGDTMAAILDHLSVDRFDLLGDIEPGFPVGRTPSSAGAPLTIAMKAGGCGSPTSLAAAVRSLLEPAENVDA